MLRTRELCGIAAQQLCEVRMLMVRNEMHGGSDPPRGELLAERVAIDPEARLYSNDIDMPGVATGRRPRSGSDPRDLLQLRVVAIGQLASLRLPTREVPKLGTTNGGLHVGHVRLQPGHTHLVPPARAGPVPLPGIPAHAVQPLPPPVSGDLGIAGRHLPPLPMGRILGP